MVIKKLGIATMLALMSTLAMAAVLNFNWAHPTNNTDGSAIPASGAGALTETVITYGPCNATRTALASVTGTVTRAVPATTGVSPDLPPGTWCGYAQSRNTYGNLSTPSNVGFRVIEAPTPNPPTNFSFGS